MPQPGAIINPHWLELPLSRANFHGPKGVRAIEVQFVVVVLLFYVHGKHQRSCPDGQLIQPYFFWAGLDLLSS